MEKSRSGKNLKNTRDRVNVKEIAMCGLFVAVALIFSYVESLLPLPMPVPGFKLGFANIAIISVLYLYSVKEAFFVNVVRIILAALLFGHGNVQQFFFSLAGGMASLGVMALLKRFDKFSVIGVSAVGGVVHNIAQVLIAILILSSVSIGYLIPVFIVIGVVTGIIAGIAAKAFLKHIKNLNES